MAFLRGTFTYRPPIVLVCCPGHAHRLRPAASRGWCAAAAEETSASHLAPLAQATLTLRAGHAPGAASTSAELQGDGGSGHCGSGGGNGANGGSSVGGSAGGGGGGGGLESGLSSASLHVADQQLHAASQLTAMELALAQKLLAACRAVSSDGEGGTCRWEGSAGWVRAQLHAYIAGLASAASEQLALGDATPLRECEGWLERAQ